MKKTIALQQFSPVPVRGRITFGSTRVVLAAGLLLLHSGVQGESGVSVDHAAGNTLNPSGASTVREKDADGLSFIEFSRSPTGFLVSRPNVVKPSDKTESGWLYKGDIEIGGLGLSGGKRASKFIEYSDLKSGAYLNNFSLQMSQPETAYFVESHGGGLGRHDQYVGLSFGKYNEWRVKSFYRETPHVFTTQYRSLWSGVGSSNLTLNTLPPGGTTNAAITDINIGNAALATPYSELAITRKKGGVNVDVKLTEHWSGFVSYTHENRGGARPFGLVSGAGGGTGGVETPESINYNTLDLVAGVRYNDKVNSLNVSASSSIFRNKIDTLTIDNPLFVAPANGLTLFPRAVFDLYPNNEFFNLKGEYARALPDFYRGHFTALVSTSSSKQDDALIPSTPYGGVTVNNVAGGAWNTVASLSKTNAGGKIDSKLADVSITLRPATGLDIKAKARYYETDNSSEYLACNPLTGQWGRLINDGSGAAIVNTAAYLAPGVRCNIAATAALGVVPSGGNLDIRSIAYAYKQMTYTLSGDYRVDRAHSVNAAYERETFDRTNRERAETNEDRIKLSYINRGLEGGTIRLSAENARRRGSTYNSDPYSDFYSVALGPFPTANATNVAPWIRTNNLHRKTDVADRDQHIVNARFNYALAPDMDISANVQGKDIKYPDSSYGRNDRQKLDTASVDFNWQPSATFGAYASVSHQTGSMSQRGLQPAACAIGTSYNFLNNGVVQTTALTPAQISAGITIVATQGVSAANYLSVCGVVSPTSPLYPTSRTWSISHKDKNDFVSLGAHYQFPKARFETNYTYARGVTAIKYAYNAAALGITPAQVALIGEGFPDLLYVRNTVESNLLLPISAKLSARLMVRYETGKVRDWHYDGIAANPTPNNNQQTFLDSGPQGYKATVVGLFVRLDL